MYMKEAKQKTSKVKQMVIKWSKYRKNRLASQQMQISNIINKMISSLVHSNEKITMKRLVCLLMMVNIQRNQSVTNSS